MDQHFDREARRESIRQEVTSNSSRSDREIARQFSVCHKTVALIRKSGDLGGDFSKGGDLTPAPTGDFGPYVSRHLPPPEETPKRGLDWSDVPEDAPLFIPPQNMTAAWVDRDTGDLLIMQDQQYDYHGHDAVIRIREAEVPGFLDALANLRAKH